MNEATTIFALLAALFALRYVWYRTTQVAVAASAIPQEMSDDSFIAGFRAPLPRHTADNDQPVLLIAADAVLGSRDSSSLTPAPGGRDGTTRQHLKETVLRMSAIIRNCHCSSAFQPRGAGSGQSHLRSTPLSGLRAGEPPFWSQLFRQPHLFHARALRPLLISNLNSLFPGCTNPPVKTEDPGVFSRKATGLRRLLTRGSGMRIENVNDSSHFGSIQKATPFSANGSRS